MRFFYVDPNWIDALIDGALAVAADRPTTAAALTIAGSALRPQTTAAAPTTGVMLRSAAVTDWPGLRLTAFSDSAGNTVLDPTRLEHIAPDVILAIYPGVLRRVELAEPAQHLHFGVGSLQSPEVMLRWIDGAMAGAQVATGPSGQCPVTMRTDPRRAVVDMTHTAHDIQTQLASAYPGALPPFAAAALAVQFLTAAQTQPFVPPDAKKASNDRRRAHDGGHSR